MTALHSPADLAAMFGGDTTVRKVLDWRREYGWPCIEVGRTIRFTDQDVEAILSRHRVATEEKGAPPVIGGQTAQSARRSS
jgi:hypothetical protein